MTLPTSAVLPEGTAGCPQSGSRRRRHASTRPRPSRARGPPTASVAPGRTTTRALALKGVPLGLEGRFTSVPVPCRNEVAMLEGADPALRDEYVAVTAHLDTSTPEVEGVVYNGADDNTSGARLVCEVTLALGTEPLPWR